MVISNSPIIKRVSPQSINLLWLSTFFSLFALAPVSNHLMGFFLVLVFVIATKLLPQKIWHHKTWHIFYKMGLLFILSLWIFLLLPHVDKSSGTLLLMIIIIINSLQIKNRKNIQTTILFNISTPFIAFLQIQSSLSSVCGLLAIILALLVSYSMNVEVNKKYFNKTKNTHFIQLIKSFLYKIALLSPLVFILYIFAPRLSNPFFGGFFHGQTKTGISNQMNVSQWTKLFQDQSPAFLVHFEGSAPSEPYLYFKGITMWHFNGKTWKDTPSIQWTKKSSLLNNKNNFIKNKNKTYQYTILNQNLSSKRLFIWGNVTASNVDIVNRDHGQYYSVYNNDSIKITSLDNKTTHNHSDLPMLEKINALQLPKGNNPKTVAFAKRLRKHSKNEKVYINKVLRFFKDSGFSYSLESGSFGNSNYVDNFLFKSKTGFCAHYSSAFAVMMRAVGIPARIATGYAVENPQKRNEYIQIKQSYAHAWDEVWINGKWTTFDPTAEVSNIIKQDKNKGSLSSWSSFSLMGSWMKNKWSQWFVYYNNTDRKALVKKIKSKLHSMVNRFSHINKIFVSSKWYKTTYFYIVISLIFFTGLLIYIKNSFFLTKNQLIKKINNWFIKQDKMLPRNKDWQTLKKLLYHKLSSDEIKKLEEALQQAENYIYGNQKNLLPYKIWYNFKHIKK